MCLCVMSWDFVLTMPGMIHQTGDGRCLLPQRAWAMAVSSAAARWEDSPHFHAAKGPSPLAEVSDFKILQACFVHRNVIKQMLGFLTMSIRADYQLLAHVCTC